MPGLLNLSEAAALAIHTMVLLASNQDRLLTTRQIAEAFSASEHHLAKVMQQLVKSGFVTSTRGPSGGFRILGELKKITLMAIYEAIDGKFNTNTCLFRAPVCHQADCILGSLSRDLHDQVDKYFRETTLETLKNSPIGNFTPWAKAH